MPVFPGDRFQPTARDWNKLQENLPQWQAPKNGGHSLSSYPTIPTMLRWDESRRPVLGEAVVMRDVGPYTAPYSPTSATVPIDPGMTLTDEEETLWRGHEPIAEIMHPVFDSPRADDHVAICISPRNQTFMIHGFSWVRLRHLRQWHRFARRCLPQEGDGAVENEKSIGCLDSCAWGPVEIIRVVLPGGDFAAGWYWAFVRL